MKIRHQLFLTKEQKAIIRKLAYTQNLSQAEVVRQVLNTVFENKELKDQIFGKEAND